MCDSFVALGNSTASGSVLLAKSADTEVNEAEHVVRYPRWEYRDGHGEEPGGGRDLASDGGACRYPSVCCGAVPRRDRDGRWSLSICLDV